MSVDGPRPDRLVPFEPGGFADRVVDLAGVRIARGRLAQPPSEKCKHRRLTYSAAERQVQCEDCQRTIEGFDAFMVLTNHFLDMQRVAEQNLHAAEQSLAGRLVSRASQAVDKVWRGRNMAVCCPHCRRGMLPEDFADGVGAAVSRDFETKCRERDKARKPA